MHWKFSRQGLISCDGLRLHVEREFVSQKMQQKAPSIRTKNRRSATSIFIWLSSRYLWEFHSSEYACNDDPSGTAQVPTSFSILASIQSGREDRLRFFSSLLKDPVRYSEFLSIIVFTDECTFRLNGHVNLYKSGIWLTECSKEGIQVPVNSLGIIFLCGI